ncbi:MAG: L-rhamnose mutarotase [Chitinophagaceae bacterium]|nr:L-rhamnose mutarotase [Chitinophagaceae bacterium]
MQRLAFKMKLHKGFEAEYEKRHNELWPELHALLKQTGIQEYSIFLDRETNFLFGYLQVADSLAMDALPQQPVMKRWWHYMKDIMEVNADESPVSIPLKEVFYMP